MMQEPTFAELRDIEIAKRLRSEHQLLGAITASLKAATEMLPNSGRRAWLDTLRERYEHFRAHMTKRIALEEVGGFMKAVEQRRPTLAPQIKHLRSEHEKILGLVDAVHRELDQLDPTDTEAIKDSVLRIRLILSEVAQHEQSESLLVGFVFTQDIGGEE